MNMSSKIGLLLFGALISASGVVSAGHPQIRCFVDAKGVTNCTNISASKPVQAKQKASSAEKKPLVEDGVSAETPAPAAQVSAVQPSTPVQSASKAVTPPVAVSPPASGQARTTYIYRYKQKNGVAHFTNVPNSALPLISTAVYQSFDKGWSGSLFKSTNWKLNREAYNDSILSLANEKEVDPALVRAVIHAESSFNPSAISRTGAMGLMQLMPGTAARFGVANAFDPHENIRGGVTYLRFLLDKFNGDVRLAAAGYNAGEGAVMKYGGVPPYSETTEYVARVLDLHGKYRGEH